MTPTQRTLAECKRRGWFAQVVERYNQFARRRIDLFGVIDVVAITPDGILGIQTTTGTGHAARCKKILAEARALAWVEAGGLLAVWSWSKRGARSKRKLWRLRADQLVSRREAIANQRTERAIAIFLRAVNGQPDDIADDKDKAKTDAATN